MEKICIKYAIIIFVGAVAQLGEHCVRIAGVRGSNPLSSTSVILFATEAPRLGIRIYFIQKASQPSC